MYPYLCQVPLVFSGVCHKVIYNYPANVLNWSSHKWAWSLGLLDSKIGCIWTKNWWNKWIFCVVLKIQESYKLLQYFLVRGVKNNCGHLVMKLKLAVSPESVDDFWLVDSDVISICQTVSLMLHFWLFQFWGQL